MLINYSLWCNFERFHGSLARSLYMTIWLVIQRYAFFLTKGNKSGEKMLFIKAIKHILYRICILGMKFFFNFINII